MTIAQEPRLSIIVAASQNNVIGNQGDLPWRMPADLKYFKQLTMNHAMIMGRTTYESIGRPLPGRTTIVLSRSATENTFAEGVLVARSLEDAIQSACSLENRDGNEIFITGGSQIYDLALPKVNRIYLTRIQATVEGDAFFPELDNSIWKSISKEDRPADEKNEHNCSFEVYERR